MNADLVIIGAGPAGCAAAISALNAGMSVTLLEIKSPTARTLPGETLHPGVEPILQQLGVWDDLVGCGFHRHAGIWREAESGERAFEPYGADSDGGWRGLQVDRSAFHSILQTHVKSLGGKIIHAAKIETLKRSTAVPPDVLRTSAGGTLSGLVVDGCEHTARFVLDATGRHAWLAKKLRLRDERRGPEQRLVFGWANAALPDLDAQPLFRQRNDGWDWIAPLAGGRHAWAKLRRTTKGKGLDYTWRIYRECAGPGYFLLGDAASLMDPSAANGVLRALMSGIYAVHLIRAVFQGQVSEDFAALDYRQWMSRMFDTTASSLSKAEALRRSDFASVGQ